MNQTGALMGPQCAGPDQTTIRPGQSLFQHTTISAASELGWPTTRKSQPAIQADRKDQAKSRVQGQVVQDAMAASRAAGCISSWGTSA